MALVADSGAIYALYDASDTHHAAVRRVIEEERGPVILPMAILGELDYLLREFLGVDAELDFLDGLITGAYSMEPLTPTDVERCRQLLARYRDLDLGLVDAAVIATAERLGVRRIFTTDVRDFRTIRSIRGDPFVLLPADLSEGL